MFSRTSVPYEKTIPINIEGFSEHKKNAKEKIKLFGTSKEHEGGPKILSVSLLKHHDSKIRIHIFSGEKDF
jgi:hypothetical protein